MIFNLLLTSIFIVFASVMFYRNRFKQQTPQNYSDLFELLRKRPDRAQYKDVTHKLKSEYSIESWEELGFENPVFPEFIEAGSLGMEFLVKTNISKKLVNYNNQDFYELNLAITLNRIITDYLFYFARQQLNIGDFFTNCEKEVLKFEKFWLRYRNQITNNLEFNKYWRLYQQKYWKIKFDDKYGLKNTQ